MRPLVRFDFDGVLVDSLDYFLDAFLDSCRENGCPQIASRHDFLALFDVNFYAGLARAGIDESRRKAILHGMAQRLAAKSGRYGFYPGIPDALREIASFADLYVISSNDGPVVKAFLDEHGLTVCRGILGGDHDTSKVRKIRTVSRLHPDALTLYVGDTAGDIIEAREAGAVAIGAAWGWHGEERLRGTRPDLLLRSPDELPAGLIAYLNRSTSP